MILLGADAKANFIDSDELAKLVLEGLRQMIRAAVANPPLKEGDQTRIAELQRAFGVEREALGGDGLTLVKATVLSCLDAGKINQIQITLDKANFAPRLDADERIVWAFPGCVHLMMVTESTFVAGSQGISVRIAHGIYYRAGAATGHRVQTEHLKALGTGALIVATKNIYFVAPHQALKLPLRKLVSVQLYSDGVELLPGGTKPHIFMVNDPEFLANLLSRLGHG